MKPVKSRRIKENTFMITEMNVMIVANFEDGDYGQKLAWKVHKSPGQINRLLKDLTNRGFFTSAFVGRTIEFYATETGKELIECCKTLLRLSEQEIEVTETKDFVEKHRLPSSRYRPHNKIDRSKAKELFDKGLTDSEVCQELDCSMHTILAIKKELGLGNLDRRKKVDEKKLLELVEQGLNNLDISEELGVSVQTVYAYKRKHGLNPTKKRIIDYESRQKLFDILSNKGYIFSFELREGNQRTILANLYRFLLNNGYPIKRFKYVRGGRGSAKHKLKTDVNTNRFVVYFFESERFRVLYEILKRFENIKKILVWDRLISPILNKEDIILGNNSKKILFNDNSFTLKQFIEHFEKLGEIGEYET